MPSSALPFIPSVPYYTFSTPIDGVAYQFRVRWNSSEELWHVDVFEEDGTPIIMGVSIVLGAYLGRASTHPLFMNNIIVARAPKDDFREASFDDLGTRVVVRLFSREDAAAEIMASVGEESR